MKRLFGRRHAAGRVRLAPDAETVTRTIGEDARERFNRFRPSSSRSFFPHAVTVLPKPGPDARRLARWMRGRFREGEPWQIVVHGTDAALQGFPDELFFDADLIWHQQHFGVQGHVAYGMFVRSGRTLYGLNYVSDLVQRSARRPDCRSRVANRFGGWADVVVHAGLRLAESLGCTRLRSPTSGLVRRFTDRERDVQSELFERVYDRTLSAGLAARREGDWWTVELAAVSDRLLPEHEERTPLPTRRRRICVLHDIERGIGHRRVDPEFARHADEVAPGHLTTMLEIEHSAGVHATYNVVGTLLRETRPEIERHGHAVAFHSFDHTRRRGQLDGCRSLDYRIRGYRPPQSRMTRELRDSNLTWHNFDWLAVGQAVLGEELPFLERGLAKIPIFADDFALYESGIGFDEWAEQVLRGVESREFAAVGLHDCYGDFWIPSYAEFLEELLSLGELMTMDDVANEVFLSAAL